MPGAHSVDGHQSSEFDRLLAEGLRFHCGMAMCCAVPRSRLHALFREALACAASAFVRRRRLERACVMLVGFGAPIHRVAELSGFPGQFRSSRAFKRVHGVSQSVCRERAHERLLCSDLGRGQDRFTIHKAFNGNGLHGIPSILKRVTNYCLRPWYIQGCWPSHERAWTFTPRAQRDHLDRDR
jgi:AraC-like DNA-binding protein